eukprot:TRINITY_DN4133_c0_g1_i1.p1 TRINITY_DN4133_c0_g1~~TRINITY_DN4133_c0_g1_i1.p1  ORF type:complete len:245 (+),score=23.32 TRINITY_DN4133_c0_g1_i1:41-736(+)
MAQLEALRKQLEFIRTTTDFTLTSLHKIDTISTSFKDEHPIAQALLIEFQKVQYCLINLSNFLFASIPRLLDPSPTNQSIGLIKETPMGDTKREWFLTQILHLLTSCAWASSSVAYSCLHALAKLTNLKKTWSFSAPGTPVKMKALRVCYDSYELFLTFFADAIEKIRLLLRKETKGNFAVQINLRDGFRGRFKELVETLYELKREGDIYPKQMVAFEGIVSSTFRKEIKF